MAKTKARGPKAAAPVGIGDIVQILFTDTIAGKDVYHRGTVSQPCSIVHSCPCEHCRPLCAALASARALDRPDFAGIGLTVPRTSHFRSLARDQRLESGSFALTMATRATLMPSASSSFPPPCRPPRQRRCRRRSRTPQRRRRPKPPPLHQEDGLEDRQRPWRWPPGGRAGWRPGSRGTAAAPLPRADRGGRTLRGRGRGHACFILLGLFLFLLSCCHVGVLINFSFL